MDLSKLLSKLEQSHLPGWEAQKKLMPGGRNLLPEPEAYTEAAVLLALYPQNGEIWFPLIKRSHDGFAHSGQIALPGGRMEAGESYEETATREAWEEVGLPIDACRLVGRLSPLPIPVSGFRVQPVIATLEQAPSFTANPLEVAQIIPLSVQELCAKDIRIHHRELHGRIWEIPYFDVNGHRLWGATAMILSEFREMIFSRD